MKVRNDITYSPKASTPTFGAIKYDSAVDTLKRVLSIEELQKFKTMVKSCNGFDCADVIFFGEGKKLTARIADTTSLKEGFKTSDHSPWFFESNMNFIQRMVQKMKDRHQKVSEILQKQNFEL